MEQLVTPVAFIIFNRINKVKKVFEAIRQAKPPKLYLISDAPREYVEGEKEKVAAVREYVENHIDWECEVFKNYAETNMGCGKRPYSGINWVFECEEEAIFLEDDCLPDQTFFIYCQEMLEHYRDDERIMTIGGTNLATEYQTTEPYLFTKVPHLWGWASWRRAWKLYDFELKDWEKQKKNPKFREIFPLKSYWVYMSEFDVLSKGGHDAWDYQMMYATILNDKLNIAAGKNYIQNIGFDEEATHTVEGTSNEPIQINQCKFPIPFRKEVVWDKNYDMVYFKKTNRHGLIVKIKSILGLDINKSIFEK